MTLELENIKLKKLVIELQSRLLQRDWDELDKLEKSMEKEEVVQPN